MFLIICSADPLENHLKYKYLLLLVVLSDAKIGLTHGKDLALGELGEETGPVLRLQFNPHLKMK